MPRFAKIFQFLTGKGIIVDSLTSIIANLIAQNKMTKQKIALRVLKLVLR